MRSEQYRGSTKALRINIVEHLKHKSNLKKTIEKYSVVILVENPSLQRQIDQTISSIKGLRLLRMV